MEEKESLIVMPDGSPASSVEREISREFKGKQDIINEIAERIFKPEHEALLDSVIDKIMKKGNVDITMESYVSKNFGSLIVKFPDLQEIHLELTRSKLNQNRRERRKRKKRK